MDLQMPVMDGYEATIAIRNGEVGVENATIPIAVTADVMESTKSRTAEIGMNHYLSKPIKKSVICDSERASLAQPYKDVFNAFFSDSLSSISRMSVRDFNIRSILQNHNFVGQIQVFFYD
jgi:CheY-like chemotaxis protein